MSGALLETSCGLVFEDKDRDLYIAYYDECRHSLTGPTWQVLRLDYATCQEDPEPPIYRDYATQVGRDWAASHRTSYLPRPGAC